MKFVKMTLASMAALLLSMVGMVQIASAQDDATNMRMISAFELVPAKAEKWNKGWAEIIKLADEHDYPYVEFVTSHQNMRWVITPISNYGDIDKVNAARGAVFKADEKAFADAIAKMDKATMNSQTFITRLDPDLSYAPEGAASGAYLKVDTYNFRHGKAKDVKEVLAGYKALATELNIEHGYQVFWNAIGSPGESVTIVSTSADALSMAKQTAAVDALLQTKPEKFKELFGGFVANLVSSEEQAMTFQPDWSMNIPEQ